METMLLQAEHKNELEGKDVGKKSNYEMIAPSGKLPAFFSVYEDRCQLIPGHWHGHIEILMVLEGQFYVGIHEQEYALQKGDIFVINSGDIHSTRGPGCVKILLLQVPYDYLERYVRDFAQVRFWECFRNDTSVAASELCRLQAELMEMQRLFEEKEDGYELAFNASLHHFLHMLYVKFSSRVELSGKEQKNAERLRQMISYISRHYREPLTLGEMAHMAALNREYFCRIFKKYTGINFLEYVNQVRLTHVYAELISTEDTVTEILERNGFTNYRIFRRMFREAYGGTPSEVRKREKDGRE